MDEEAQEIITEKLEPIEVKIINKDKKESTPYTQSDNEMYENINITEDEITEFIENDST